MKRKYSKEVKIVIDENRTIRRKELFENKAKFHKEQANLPFEEKIKILVKLQKIANQIKGWDRIIWKL